LVKQTIRIEPLRAGDTNRARRWQQAYHQYTKIVLDELVKHHQGIRLKIQRDIDRQDEDLLTAVE
jgi:3'-phosphoadenosine 5'-phosphosulfate sulfotransferase (PAPS reductase)/FAD synthetase